MDVKEKLLNLCDLEYKKFQSALLPTVDSDRIMGIRTPELKKIAYSMYVKNEYKDFISVLPHEYFEENNLHGFIVCEIKDFDTCMSEVERFLPYIDNWATCDQFRPRAFSKRREVLIDAIRRWIASEHTYTVRFGIGMLMSHFLDKDFLPEYLDMVFCIDSDQYYVNMMQAWFFATALAKQYKATLPYIEDRRLPRFVHNMTIRKACESFRIDSEQKAFLKSMKM